MLQVRALLEGDIKATDPKPFQMVKSVYQSCMNREAIEQRGHDPVKSILKKLGGWPLLEGAAWNSSEFQWFELIYKFREQGFSVDYFFDFSVVSDLKNSTWRTLDLDQPGLLMSREYLMKGLDDSDVQAYLCNFSPRPGKLDIDKCVEFGIKPGPVLGKLKSGQDVTLEDGR